MDTLWYYSDIVDRMRTYFPPVGPLPAARILTAGTLPNKTLTIKRAAGSFDEHAIVAVHRGSGYLVIDQESVMYDLHSGDLFFLSPGRYHRYAPKAGESWDESYLTFAGEVFDSLQVSGVIPKSDPVIRSVPKIYLERMLSLVRLAGSFAATSPSVYLGMLIGLICELGGSLRPSHLSPRDHEWLTEVHKAFDSPRPAVHSLNEVARDLGTSHGSFVKKFTRLTGLSPGRAKFRSVMDRAAMLLRDEQLSVTQVADELGYCDPAYFCRRFRQHTGFSPGEFRRLSLGS